MLWSLFFDINFCGYFLMTFICRILANFCYHLSSKKDRFFSFSAQYFSDPEFSRIIWIKTQIKIFKPENQILWLSTIIPGDTFKSHFSATYSVYMAAGRCLVLCELQLPLFDLSLFNLSSTHYLFSKPISTPPSTYAVASGVLQGGSWTVK